MNEYFTIMWGDTDIGKILESITKIERGIGNKWNNSLVAGTGRYGYKFQSNHLDSKTIKITFAVRGNQQIWAKFRRTLAGILDTKTIEKLTFNDEPGVYYNAVPDGAIDLSEDITTGYATGTLTFLVPDGISHSTVTKVWDSTNPTDLATLVTNHDDGSVSLELNTDSTATIYPKITLEMTSNNGYIGIVTDESVIAVGSQPETVITERSSSKTHTVSEWLSDGTKTNWKDAWTSSAPADRFPNAQNGSIIPIDTLDYGINQDFSLVMLNHDPTPSTPFMIHAGCKAWTTPADSNGEVGASSFSSYSNMFFHAAAMGETGLMQILYLDENKKLVVGYGLYKDDMKGNKFHIQLYVGGTGQMTYRSFDNFEANNGGHGDGKVPNPNLYFNSTTGGMTVKKDGAHLSWTFNSRGGTYNCNAWDLKDTKVKYVAVYIGNIKNRNMARGTMVQSMVFKDFTFQKFGIPKTSDITTDITKIVPEDVNRFKNKEKIVIDLNSQEVFRHDGTIPALDQVITGSRFAGLSPASNTIAFMFSKTATMPKIKIEWEERYI